MAKQNGKTKGYNGYKNYSQWNQSLWLNNDEGLYLMAKDYCSQYKREDAVAYMLDALNSCGITHTPDRVKWSKAGIRAGMVGL